jgi:hypothetical protein
LANLPEHSYGLVGELHPFPLKSTNHKYDNNIKLSSPFGRAPASNPAVKFLVVFSSFSGIYIYMHPPWYTLFFEQILAISLIFIQQVRVVRACNVLPHALK